MSYTYINSICIHAVDSAFFIEATCDPQCSLCIDVAGYYVSGMHVASQNCRWNITNIAQVLRVSSISLFRWSYQRSINVIMGIVIEIQFQLGVHYSEKLEVKQIDRKLLSALIRTRRAPPKAADNAVEIESWSRNRHHGPKSVRSPIGVGYCNQNSLQDEIIWNY